VFKPDCEYSGAPRSIELGVVSANAPRSELNAASVPSLFFLPCASSPLLGVEVEGIELLDDCCVDTKDMLQTGASV
jgi:hypothetical protein